MAAIAAACNETRAPGGFETDQVAPVVAIDKSSGDTLTLQTGVRFSVAGADNLGLRSVSIEMTGGLTLTLDTVFTTAVTTVTLAVAVPLPSNTTAGGVIVIRATASDGNNNLASAVDSVYLINEAALTVRILSPSAGSVTSAGRQIPIEVIGSQQTGVRLVGYTTTGAVTASDSVGGGSPAPDTVTFTDTLDIPANAQPGTFVVTGFAVDSGGRRATSTPVTVTIQSITADSVAPIVSFTVGKRSEIRDSIRVRATDPSGIQTLGWEATDRNTGAVVGGATTNIGGQLTDAARTYNLNFAFGGAANFVAGGYPVIIRAFATDANGNTGEARFDTTSTSPVRRDTILVVNGITKLLPAGGRVADAIYNRNLNEFYLTNVVLDRLEVFRVADTTFAANIRVGSRPWGIALWPRSQTGDNADTVMVANSGGTNISVVNVGTRREVRRHALPNFIIHFVQTEIDPATQLIKIKFEEFDFSDRPQYLGAFCRTAGAGPACAADSVYAVYSTTPTADQSQEFAFRGTVRWENLTAGVPQSHFFWEQAAIPPSPDSDTLEIFVDRGPGVAIQNVLSAACGVTVDRRAIAFNDTTFVRNSGDFTHALVGEGGQSDFFARAIGFHGNTGVTITNCAANIGPPPGIPFAGPLERDDGISPAIRVNDFISNTAVSVRSIGINFNGLTNLIRADSVYVLDEGLRLVGLVQTQGGNAGMDVNFDHRFNARTGGTPGTDGGGLSPNDRFVFMASDSAQIDIYDTWFYGLVSRIQVRDPIIGPLRAARLASGEQVIIGVTPRGVVTVRFPTLTNPFPVRRAEN